MGASLVKGMSTTTQLVVWRESVCAGDDCDAPHELILTVGNDSLRGVTDRLIAAHYLASITGGRATWILQAGDQEGRSLAVLAQEWAQPRFLVASDAEALTYVQSGARPHLLVRYWCQVDPAKVFDCLQRGEPLPDRHGR